MKSMTIRSGLLVIHLVIGMTLVAAPLFAVSGANPQGSSTGSLTAGPTLVGPNAVTLGSNRFACDLYGRLRTKGGNLFFSPASISIALAMTYAGAAGNTKAEMARTLHFPNSADEVHHAMAVLRSLWNSKNPKQGFRLDIANRLWGQQGYQFTPAFLAVTRNQYGAELFQLDFAKDSEKARNTINTWVESQTEHKITELLPRGSVDGATLVLTNAIYFKGDWSARFDKKLTADEDFHISAEGTVKSPFMRKQANFRYTAVDGLQLLELPYGLGSLSMVVLLPGKPDGLSGLEEKLTFDNLRKWSGMMRSQEVMVDLPKFKTTSDFSLGDTLKSMGMVDAFDSGKADFSGMAARRGLCISKVIHKAFVDVNEEGTEAAAATAVIHALPGPSYKRKEPPVFRADHPFVFLIRDNRNDEILFVGRITDPSK